MARVKLSEYTGTLAGSDITVDENIKYNSADSPEYDGTYMRMGAGGLGTLYRKPDNDTEYTDTDVTSIPITTTESTILSVTITDIVDSTNGSYQISGKLDNTTNQDKTITIAVYIGAVQINSENISLSKSEVGKNFMFTGTFSSSYPASTVFDAKFTANSTGVNLRGDQQTSTFKITKAAPAALTSEEVVALSTDYTDPVIESARIGTALGEVKIDEDGLRLVGTATVWDDIQGSLFGRRLNGTAGKVDYNYVENTVTFQPGGVIGTLADRVQWNIQMEHAAKADEPLEIHIHWEQVDNTPRSITIEHRVQGNGNAKTTAWTTTVIPVGGGSVGDVFTYVSGTLNQITDLLLVPLTGLGVSSIIQFRMARTDAVAVDMEVTYVDGHMQKDDLGSKTEYAK